MKSKELSDESRNDDIEFLEKTLVAASSSKKETMLKGKKHKRKRNVKRSSKDRGIRILEPLQLKRSSRRQKKDSKDGNNKERSCDQKLNEEKDKEKTIANSRSSSRPKPKVKSEGLSYESVKRCTRRPKKDSKDGSEEDRSDQKQEKHKDIGPGHVEKLRGKAKVLNEEKDERRRSLRTSS
ncbi:hypothetical protein M9H77_33003 [Catharanthus roseus]|uniref:Uncharacterized protein n=1 Tax=Catharanthus roseus TaxID=4058 RepID=A0ACC0A8J0_CATRO|nr:hypothetical protein M9H77_33003 [Catharanthus roseus]